MTSYLIVVNPAAGKGGARRGAEVLRDRLSASSESAEVRVAETTHRGSAAELVAETVASSAAEVDRIIAVGGDGTLNEVLTGLIGLGQSAANTPAVGNLP